jgi:cold shock protein
MTRATGKIKWYDVRRGFGFIAPDAGGDDVYFHISQSPVIEDHVPGLAVSYKTDISRRTGKIQAFSVDAVSRT